MKRNTCCLIFWETVLILGSIPVFRSVWMLCDGIEFMNQRTGIVLSFVAGIVLCVMALLALNRPVKGVLSARVYEMIHSRWYRQLWPASSA